MPKMTAIRGATSAPNEAGMIISRTQELITEILAKHHLDNESIVFIQVQRTPDLTEAYPGTAVRLMLPRVPVMGGVEHPIGDFDRGMIRVLVLIDKESSHKDNLPVYLHDAINLRNNIKNHHNDFDF